MNTGIGMKERVRNKKTSVLYQTLFNLIMKGIVNKTKLRTEGETNVISSD